MQDDADGADGVVVSGDGVVNDAGVCIGIHKGYDGDAEAACFCHGDVLAGRASPEELVPFGGPSAHKAFALAVGLELLVGALAGPEHGAVLLVARPEFDPVPRFRELAAGLRLPGDS